MRRLLLMVSVTALVGCGTSNPGDGNTGQDGGEGVDADAGTDGGSNDAGADAGSTPAGSLLDCFDFSLDADAPLVIDGVFGAQSPLWSRPSDESPVCPASQLLTAAADRVPYVAYAFCNRDLVPHSFLFEMISQEGPAGEPPLDDPFLVLYPGRAIPADARQCLALNDDIPEALEVKDSEIAEILVPSGGAITVVGTTYAFAPAMSTGTGYYLLVVSMTD